jgi:hypothetical protein
MSTETYFIRMTSINGLRYLDVVPHATVAEANKYGMGHFGNKNVHKEWWIENSEGTRVLPIQI